MAGPASIMGIATTLALLFLLAMSVVVILRALEKGGAPVGPVEAESATGPTSPVRRPVAPTTISLSTYTGKKDHFASSPEAMEAYQTMVVKGQMSRIGDYTIDQMPGYVIRALSHPDRNLLGIIYMDPSGRTWVNLQTEYADGRIITTSSTEKSAASLARPHGMPIFHYPAVAAEQLLRRHKLEIRGVEQAPPLPAEEFAAKFATNYARLQERAAEYNTAMLREEEAGTTSQQTGGGADWESHDDAESPFGAASAISEPEPKPDEPRPDQAPTMEQMIKWLELIFNKLKVPPDSRETFRKGLVWIEDNAPREAVIDTLNEFADVKVEPVPGERLVIRSRTGVEDIVDAEGLLGAALFEEINQHLPERTRFTKLEVPADGVVFFSRRAPNH
ncbi:MAG: hypothetical protein OEZ32_12460 [Nitrospinota bacterium]|nr:hypothetical protein [Nitrospinota bacterium]